MVYTVSGIHLPCIPSFCQSSRSGISCDRRRNLSLWLKNDSFSRKIFAGKSPYSSETPSLTVVASEKVLVPGSQSDGSSTATDPVETADVVSKDMQIKEEEAYLEPTSLCSATEETVSSLHTSGINEVQDEESSPLLHRTGTNEQHGEARQKSIPPPGTGQRIYEIDPLLKGHRQHLDYRYGQYKKMRESIDKYEGGLEAFSRGYEKFGFIRSESGVTYREWAPGAKSAALIGDFNSWNPNADIMTQNEFGVWEIFLPNNVDGSLPIPHGSRVKIRMDTPSGLKDSIPAWIKFSVQAPGEIPYNGVYYDPPEEENYVFQHPQPKKPKSLRIYESHVGMSSTISWDKLILT